MIPAGYMLKRIAARPDWLNAPRVAEIYSASDCFSPSLTATLNAWEFNSLGLADSPSRLTELAAAHSLDTSEMALFYYEIFEREYDEEERAWRPFVIEASPERPDYARLEGFDVATYSCGCGAECSPLSCNSVATEVDVNSHCLFSTFEEATAALESGVFEDCEPGPYRILAVYTVEPKQPAG